MSDDEVPEFDWNDVEIPDDVEVGLGDGSGNEQYRTCSAPVALPGGGQGVCGNDCMPEPHAEDGLGVRVVFVCPEHGVHSIVDPFAGPRQPRTVKSKSRHGLP